MSSFQFQLLWFFYTWSRPDNVIRRWEVLERAWGLVTDLAGFGGDDLLPTCGNNSWIFWCLDLLII